MHIVHIIYSMYTDIYKYIIYVCIHILFFRWLVHWWGQICSTPHATETVRDWNIVKNKVQGEPVREKTAIFSLSDLCLAT